MSKIKFKNFSKADIKFLIESRLKQKTAKNISEAKAKFRQLELFDNQKKRSDVDSLEEFANHI